jgi:hypothetical protein
MVFMIKRVIIIFTAILCALSFSFAASAQSVSQAVQDFLSSMITAEYAEHTEFTQSEINAEIRRTVRAVERTGAFDNIVIEDGIMAFDWLTLFYITDWFFKEMVYELNDRHGGFYENSEHGYGYALIVNDLKIEFPRLEEMDLILSAIEHNIVDWNPELRADATGLIEIGGFSIEEIRRLLSSGGNDEPGDGKPPTIGEGDIATLINRMDIIVGILLVGAAVSVAGIICYMIYSLVNRFF